MAETEFMTKLRSIHDDMIGWQSRQGKKFTAMQGQLDAIDLRLIEGRAHQGPTGKSVSSILKENESVSRLLHDKKGRAIITFSGNEIPELMESKTTILSGGTGFGNATGGVVPVERISGIVQEARRPLAMRDVLPAPHHFSADLLRQGKFSLDECGHAGGRADEV